MGAAQREHVCNEYAVSAGAWELLENLWKAVGARGILRTASAILPFRPV